MPHYVPPDFLDNTNERTLAPHVQAAIYHLMADQLSLPRTQPRPETRN